MSAFLFIIGLVLFACGAFCLYSGLYTGNNRAGEFAESVRTALSQRISDPKTALIIVGACLAVIGFALTIWGFIRSKREKKPRAAVSIYVLSVLGMFLAMTVMLDRFPGLSIKTPGWKIGFSFAPPMIAAMLFGPIEAALVYGLSDLLGATLFPFGPYHPGFTVVAALMGFVYGVFLNKRPFAFAGSKFEWKKIRFFPNHIVPVLINAIVLGLFVNTYWVSQLYGFKTYWGWFAYRLVEYAVLVPVQLILIPVLLKIAERLKKNSVFASRSAARSVDERLGSISRKISIPGLSRVSELLSRIGDPQNDTRVIHVAGTNGKGSFVAMLTSVLVNQGYTVGSFSSPAITGLTDSFRINGEQISHEELDELLGELQPSCGQMQDKPTEFEALTAAAYLMFKKHGCDYAIVECGMGGDLDATNVLTAPLLSVITNVRRDHCSFLGNTLAEIAEHKAGIIKRGRPVLYGGEEDEASAAVANRAKDLDAPLYRTAQDAVTVIEATLDGTRFTYRGREYFIRLLGSYQPANAANVLAAVDILRGQGVEISEDAVSNGLASARWHGRFELISNDPVVIFDGSHNPDGVSRVAESLERYFPDTEAVLLMGVMADKEYDKYPAMLAPLTRRVFAVRPDNPRALDPAQLADTFNAAGVPAEAYEDIKEGVAAAYAYAKENGLPLAAIGTLYMYEGFMEAVRPLL